MIYMNEKRYENQYKAYIKVQAMFYVDGRPPEPMALWWEDGRRFDVDRIKDIRHAASTKAGGVGIRYTCMVNGNTVQLYYEENNRWFVERKEPKQACADDIT